MVIASLRLIKPQEKETVVDGGGNQNSVDVSDKARLHESCDQNMVDSNNEISKWLTHVMVRQSSTIRLNCI